MSSKKSSTRSNPFFDPATLPTRLASLSRLRARNSDSPNVDSWKMQILDIIEKCLQAGQDATFKAALVKLEEQGEHDAMLSLTRELEWLAVHRRASLKPRGHGYLSVFAIPMVLSQDRPLELQGNAIPQNDSFHDFVKTIRGHGLPETDPTVMILPYLYTPEELEGFELSQVWNLGPCMERAIRKPGSVPPGELGQRAVAASGGDEIKDGDAQVHLGLRYLVGCAVAEDEPTLFLPNPGEDAQGNALDEEAAFSAYTEKMDRWNAEASGHLGRSLSVDEESTTVVLLYPPEPIFDAYRTGLSNAADFALTVEMAEALRETGLFAQEVNAVVIPYGDDEDSPSEFRISLLNADTQELAAGLVRHIFAHEHPPEVADELADMFDTAGIPHVEYGSDIQPLSYCECCGKPTFFAPEADVEQQNSPPETARRSGKVLH